jgi:GR25 family glycosyltransferase involved in LPS biosynthesis
MKIYIINLKRRLDRKKYMLNQLEEYGITNFEFIDAVDGDELTDFQIKKECNFKKMKRISRLLTKNEIACALSHQKVYKRIISENDNRAIILEDDTILSDTFNKIANLDGSIYKNIDIFFLHYFTSNIDGEKTKTYPYEKIGKRKIQNGLVSRCYFKNEPIDLEGEIFYKIDDISYKIDFLNSSAAYSPTIDTCKKLLELNTPIIMQSDYLWNYYHNFSLYGSLEDVISCDFSVSSSLETERKIYEHEETHSNTFLRRINSENFNI